MAKGSGRDIALENAAMEFVKYKGVKISKNDIARVPAKFKKTDSKLGFWHPGLDDFMDAPSKTKEVRGRAVTVYKPHLSMGRKPCSICMEDHSTSQHASHGIGSMARTHPGTGHKKAKVKAKKTTTKTSKTGKSWLNEETKFKGKTKAQLLRLLKKQMG